MSYSPTDLVEEKLSTSTDAKGSRCLGTPIVRRAEGKEKGPSCLDPYLNRWTVKGNLEFLCEPMPRITRSSV